MQNIKLGRRRNPQARQGPEVGHAFEAGAKSTSGAIFLVFGLKFFLDLPIPLQAM
jgi:hypothetical protein